MDIRSLIKRGLIGYQPIFFPNGVISGAGYQFFGNFRLMRAQKAGEPEADSDQSEGVFSDRESGFNQIRLGNIYVPKEVGDRSEIDSEFYYCIDEDQKRDFVRDNIMLLDMYRFYAFKSIEIAREHGIELASMIEVGANTCVFPQAFAEAGLTECHGADIVDYAPVVDVMSAMSGHKLAFHHMDDDTDLTWRSLPKADLVWSYAVVLHQSNPLAHLTRLASLGTKAMFVMTPTEPGSWSTESELGIRYRSANAYYNADFPNCFDVSVISPGLLRYSLERLGFSTVVEIPPPDFSHLGATVQADMIDWVAQHSFFLGLRDEARTPEQLEDYSIATERSPYKGENILVHAGFHNNILLGRTKYFIVPQGDAFDMNDPSLACYSTLAGAMDAFRALDTERHPRPVQLTNFAAGALIHFANRVYFVPAGVEVQFVLPADELGLHVLDSSQAWTNLLEVIGEAGLKGAPGTIVDCINGIVVLKTGGGRFEARRVLAETPHFGDVITSGATQRDVVGAVKLNDMKQAMAAAGLDLTRNPLQDWRQSLGVPEINIPT